MINKILNIARGELGYKEGTNNNTKYGADYGLNYNPWCQMFIWWIAQKAGIGEDIIPKTASCPTAYRWFKNKGQVVSPSEAKAGDIVFFQWNGSKNADHVGIVEVVNSNIITTIEGNFNNMVARRNINKSNSCIFAVCRPAYITESEELSVPEVTAKIKYVNTKIGLNVRANPDTSSSVLTAIPYKCEMVVLEENCANSNGYTWDKIQYNNTVGYVANRYLTALSTNTTTKYHVNAKSGLWLLDGNGKKIKAYVNNTEVEYISNGYTKYGYNYIKVKVLTDGNVGYMAKTYLV